MKTRLPALAFASALFLSSCAETPSPDVTTLITQIQQDVKAACAVVPTVASIVALLDAGLAGAATIVSDICSAVTAAPAALLVRRGVNGNRLHAPVTVHGVTVKFI